MTDTRLSQWLAFITGIATLGTAVAITALGGCFASLLLPAIYLAASIGVTIRH